MEFRIAKAEFLRGLRLAQGIADRKSTMPMLANVLLRTQGKNQLLVAATDLNVSLTAELKSHNASDAYRRPTMGRRPSARRRADGEVSARYPASFTRVSVRTVSRLRSPRTCAPARGRDPWPACTIWLR